MSLCAESVLAPSECHCIVYLIISDLSSRVGVGSDGGWEFYVMEADGSNQRQILENVTGQLDIYYTGGDESVLSWGR